MKTGWTADINEVEVFGAEEIVQAAVGTRSIAIGTRIDATITQWIRDRNNLKPRQHPVCSQMRPADSAQSDNGSLRIPPPVKMTFRSGRALFSSSYEQGLENLFEHPPK